MYRFYMYYDKCSHFNSTKYMDTVSLIAIYYLLTVCFMLDAFQEVKGLSKDRKESPFLPRHYFKI